MRVTVGPRNRLGASSNTWDSGEDDAKADDSALPHANKASRQAPMVSLNRSSSYEKF